LPYEDLRAFLDELEEGGDLTRVGVEVDLDQEIGAICRRSASMSGPALFFERPGQHGSPVVANVYATRERVSKALDSDPDSVLEYWRVRSKNAIEPRIVGEGPCQENVIEGDDVDLGKLFPIPVLNPLDSGPFLTAGCHISRDPVTGIRNAGVYRNEVFGPRELGVFAAPYRHMTQHQAKDPDTPLPVAIVLGVDPAVFLGSVAPAPIGTDELSLAGGLRGEPVELVACKTIPLEVPATAEIVLECELLPHDRRREGPFGEFTGYYPPPMDRPVLRIKAVTHRNDPIHQIIDIGRPPNETIQAVRIMNESNLLEQVRLPGLRKIHMPEGGSGFFTAIASIDKPFEGYGKMMAMAILGTWASRPIKLLIIVDSDVDPADQVQVDWALATRVQADRDVEIIGSAVGAALDPSIADQEHQVGNPSRTAKMIIDATRFDATTFPTAIDVDPKVAERVVERWAEYGLGDK